LLKTGNLETQGIVGIGVAGKVEKSSPLRLRLPRAGKKGQEEKVDKGNQKPIPNVRPRTRSAIVGGGKRAVCMDADQRRRRPGTGKKNTGAEGGGPQGKAHAVQEAGHLEKGKTGSSGEEMAEACVQRKGRGERPRSKGKEKPTRIGGKSASEGKEMGLSCGGEIFAERPMRRAGRSNGPCDGREVKKRSKKKNAAVRTAPSRIWEGETSIPILCQKQRI